MSIGDAYTLLTTLEMSGNTEVIATDLLREIVGRLRLKDVVQLFDARPSCTNTQRR